MKTTNIRQLKKAIAIAAVVVFLTDCAAPEKQAADEQQSAIQPPFEELTPQFTDYTLNAGEGDTFFVSSGTRFIVPPNALADDSGKAITGEATIRYREYHDALDVFLSGIPMDYISQGERRDMQTAGMFEIRAEQNGRELQIADGKKVEVGFASYEGGADYNFFKYDETNNEWAFVDYSTAVPNPEKEVIRKRITEMRPPGKISFDKTHFVLNYGSMLDVYFNDNRKKAQKNFYNAAIKKKMQKYGLEFYDVLCWNRIKFKGKEYPAQVMVWENLSGHGFAKWAKGKFCDVKPVSGSIYKMTVQTWKGKNTSTLKARCVMPLSKLFANSSKKWKKEFKKYELKLIEEERRLALEADVYRTVELSGFGIFNFDKFRRTRDMLAVSALCQIEGVGRDEQFGPEVVYCFTDDKTVFKLPAGKRNKISLDPKEKHFKIIAVLDGNRVAAFSSKRYGEIDFDALASSPAPKYNFVLETQQGTITSKKDLKKLLKI